MGKVITSPVKRWPGEVVLSDPLTFPQVIALEECIQKAEALRDKGIKGAAIDAAWVPGVCACVEEWRLEGLGQLDEKTFPAAPRISSQELMAWLIGEITNLYGESDPNE